MRIRINKAHFPVTVLGPGRRVGIWLQGCSIRCPGCVSQDTWDPKSGHEISIATLIEWCRDATGDSLDGVTISGGEPFEQPQALACLLDALQDWRRTLSTTFDVLCYTGLPYSKLLASHAPILGKIDAIVPEPFVQTRPEGGYWRGSDNQPLIAVTPLGRERYSSLSQMPETNRMRLQVEVTPERIWFIGIPSRGHMSTLEEQCAALGIAMGSVSWRN